MTRLNSIPATTTGKQVIIWKGIHCNILVPYKVIERFGALLPNDYADRSLNPTTANTQPGFTEGYKIMQQY